MKIKSNFHTHSTYCDGENTLTEMVEAAIKLGFKGIGFSGHSYTSFDEAVSMSIEGTKKYLAELEYLKRKYEGKIEIFAGIEQDIFSDMPVDSYDYVIGSVHYTYKNGVYLSVDETPELFSMAVRDYYNNDVYAFIEDYYELVSELPERTGADIIGHFDLISKFNEAAGFFDEKHPRYKAAVDRALERLIPSGKLFEINTGAISRGYKKEAYPSCEILIEIARRGGRFILSSDAHSVKAIDSGFDDVVKLLETLGLLELLVTSFR